MRRQTEETPAANSGALSLRDLLCSLAALPDEEWAWLARRLERREYAAGEALFRPGSTDAGMHFLLRGLVRYFYLTPEGVERNHTFAAEGNLAGCLPAFIGAEPCSFTVETLETVSTLLIPSDTVRALDNRHACWIRLKLRLMEHVALRKGKREAEFLLQSAEARYRGFLTKFAALEHRIPQYHIASYLGITPVALSRIRKRINLG